MAKSLLLQSRLWHRKIASVLFVFFLFISITAIMLAWKAVFTNVIFDNKKITGDTNFQKWLPLDSLELIAVNSINEKTNNKFKHAESIQLKPAKGYINFTFKNNLNIQVDGATGNTIHIEQKNGSLIQDIHDGAIVDGWVTNKWGLSKKIYSTIMGLALLLLTISGFWMWYKPKQIKQSKK
ncbi:MAG: PepSY domain-containing protein [Chitinophagaceae bacterium]